MSTRDVAGVAEAVAADDASPADAGRDSLDAQYALTNWNNNRLILSLLHAATVKEHQQGVFSMPDWPACVTRILMRDWMDVTDGYRYNNPREQPALLVRLIAALVGHALGAQALNRAPQHDDAGFRRMYALVQSMGFKDMLLEPVMPGEDGGTATPAARVILPANESGADRRLARALAACRGAQFSFPTVG